MRPIGKAFVVLLAVGPVGCANVPEQAPPPEPLQPNIACSNNRNLEPVVLNWELKVSPDGPIESGQPFRATLDGIAVLHEAFWDGASDYLRLEALNLVDLRATVHVRSGTTGDDDVTLKPDPAEYLYQCNATRTSCDPNNDLVDPDDPDDAPGFRANSDCQPESVINPCGRFIRAPIDDDCDPGGSCLSRGKSRQCVRYGFCVTGGIEIELEEQTVPYTAATDKTEVLFGWDDQEETTGAKLAEDGTWILRSIYDENSPLGLVGYQEKHGPISIRATFSGAPGALECTRAVSCADPDFALDCPAGQTTRAPDEALISFPIQPEAP